MTAQKDRYVFTDPDDWKTQILSLPLFYWGRGLPQNAHSESSGTCALAIVPSGLISV